MKKSQKLLYRIKVKVTNSTCDTFKMDEFYYNCQGTYVFVAANTLGEAAEQIPHALQIEEFGVFLDNTDK